MERVRPWYGQLLDRGLLKNRTEQCRPLARSDMLEYADPGPTQHWIPGSNPRPHHKKRNLDLTMFYLTGGDGCNQRGYSSGPVAGSDH